MKKKILFINPSLRQGGVEHSLVTTLKLLDPDKYDITLYVYNDMTDLMPEVPEYVRVIVRPDNTKYFRKPYSVLKYLQFRIYGLSGDKKKAESARGKMYAFIHRKKTEYPHKELFSRDHFDVIVSYSLHIGTEMGLKIDADRRYVMMHSSDPEYHREIIEGALDKYDKIIAVSESVAGVYREAYPSLADRIITIPNYVDAERTLRLADAEAELPIPDDAEWIIATCGRISHEKGFDLAVDAAAILKNRGVSFRWLFIGDGADREKIEKAVSDGRLEKEIMITGFQSNPFPYMKAAMIYVQPSYEEAQPLVLLEAMILGTPIVSTKTVGGRHILEDGKKGVLADFTAVSLAEGILSLTGSPEKRDAFSNLYSPDDNMRERQGYINRWESLLSGQDGQNAGLKKD